MHHLALYEIDRSYHQVQGEWLAEDDFRPSGMSEHRLTETLRVVAPSEELAVALVSGWHRTGFSEDAKVKIDAVRHIRLDGMISQTH